LRILIVSQYFWPENFRLNELVDGLVARGHEITVLTGLPNYPSGTVFSDFKESPDSFQRYGGASIVRVPIVPRGRNRVKLALNYLSFVLSGSTVGPWKLRGRQFDVVFAYLVSPVTAALPALLIGRLKKAPTAIWILDLWPETLSALDVVRSRFVLGCVGQLVSFIYRRTARIFVQSQTFVSSIVRYGGSVDKILYLPGWSEKVFDEALPRQTIVSEFGAQAGKFKIVFAGNIGDAQDFPSVLDAVEALRDRADIHWFIVGEGRAKAELLARIEERGLGHLVTLLGQHPIERMPAFFSAADALLVSLRAGSIFEMTIPGKVQSYLAAGVPILGMLDGEGARVIVESGGGYACPAGNGAELAQQVLRLTVMSPSERAAMGAKGRAYAIREFNREQLIDRMELSLREAIHSPR
jgi:glycosyltransferase involved in cell wall biosynthesis